MGLAGAMAEDAEAEYITKLTETDIVSGNHTSSCTRCLQQSINNSFTQFKGKHIPMV